MTTELTKAAQQALDALKKKHGHWGAGHDQLNAEAIAALERALTQRPAALDVDWSTPTTYAQRFSEAVALLCRETPPADMVAGWLDLHGVGADDHRLQDWACERAPAWAQGIGLLDAAHIMAGQPTEGVDHEPAPQQATPDRHLTVTTNQQGEAVMVSWQDAEHRILEVVWERKQATPEPVGEPVAQVSDLFPSVRNKLHAQGFDADAPLYTRPAPGVPEPSINWFGTHFTYKNQPCDNVTCWRLGEAARSAKPGGDLIDHGLSLLHELEKHGYGVYSLAAAQAKGADHD